jgi:hypothetical protein
LLRVVWISFVVTLAAPILIGMLAGGAIGAILVPMSVGRVGAIPVVSILVGDRQRGIGILLVSATGACGSGNGAGGYRIDRQHGSEPGVDGISQGKGLRHIGGGNHTHLRGHWLFQSPAYFIGGLHFTRGRLIASTWSAVIIAAGAFAGSSLAGPILTIALTLVYYDERVRREGFDLEFMMASLASIPENAAVSSTV